jgi:leucyl-tRNA synthetase
MQKIGSVCDAKAGWPAFDETKVALQTMTIAVQEKGKLRGTVEMPAGASEREVLAAVQQNEKLKKVAGAATKHVFVKDKIINFI